MFPTLTADDAMGEMYLRPFRTESLISPLYAPYTPRLKEPGRTKRENSLIASFNKLPRRQDR